MSKSNPRTTTTKNGETFEYVRLRVKADTVEALEKIRPKHLNLTEFLNELLDVAASARRQKLRKH